MPPRRPAFAQAAGYAMTSGVSWNEPEFSPQAQRGAGEAARRAGLSNSISARLEELSQRIGGMGAAAPVASSVRGARLSETVAKLNARLEQMTTGDGASPGQGAFEAAPRSRAPQSAPEPFEPGIDQVIAEIT